jgi:chromatin remodeling complex protein RSC6
MHRSTARRAERGKKKRRVFPLKIVDTPRGIRHLLVTAARRREKIGIDEISASFIGEPNMAKKKAAKKSATRKKSTAKRKPNAAFMKPMNPSATLAAVIGSSAMPRTEVTKKIWAYIKRNSLQDKKNRRMINADDKLKPVFGGKAQVSMFEMTKLR